MTTTPLIYTAPTGNRANGRVHRASCKHIAKTATILDPANVGPDAIFDATRATCCSPKPEDVKAAIAEAENGPVANAAPADAPKAAEPAADAPKPAKPAKAKASKPKADKAARTVIGTFDATDKETHKCAGACGQKLAVKKFPTTATPGVRSAECRPCRDARTKAEKAGA